jgi:phage tail sheath protein FI
MAQLKFGSAGVTSREIDISGPITQQPVGIPAGIIGTSIKGPAFVPITVGTLSDWYSKFGTTDGKKFGPLAVVEWLRSARSVAYLRVLGAGDGRARDTVTGKVTSAGFVVGERQPGTNGVLTDNPHANPDPYLLLGAAASATFTCSPYTPGGGENGRYFSFLTPANQTVKFVLVESMTGSHAPVVTNPSPGVFQSTIPVGGGVTTGKKLADKIFAGIAPLYGLGALINGGNNGAGVVTISMQDNGALPNGSLTFPSGSITEIVSSDFSGGVDDTYLGPDLGRTYFLGCFMSESAGSTFFSEAGLQGPGGASGGAAALPIIRGVLMAPSGVVLRLSSTFIADGGEAPTATTVGTDADAKGAALGTVVLKNNNEPRQEFTMFLNGHLGSDARYPRVLTASFDPTANNYFAKSFNTDPYKLQEAGHFLYANWDVHPTLAVITGSGLVDDAYSADSNGGLEPSAFIVTSSLGRNESSTTVPDYESFEDRFSHAVSPWIVSQKFGGKPQDLFRIHALDDGAGISSKFKVSVENVTVSNDPLNKYGSFTVSLREFGDRDLDKKNLPNEVFAGVNLDPSSDRYIAKVIGDVHAYFDFDREESSQKIVVEGNYENRSNYIRVEVHPDIENGFVDPVALPMGFRGIDHLVTSGSAPMQEFGIDDNGLLAVTDTAKKAQTPPLPFRRKITSADEWSVKEQTESKFYWGVQFEHPENLIRKNGSILPNASIKSFALAFPNFSISDASFLTGSNAGQPDSADLGILDADRFCNNFFSLENIQVVTGSNGLASPTKWSKAVYVRNGAVGSTNLDQIATDGKGDENKVRGFKVEDIPTNKQFAKFTLIMQGGQDGVNIFDRNETEINNNAVMYDMDPAAARASKPEEGPNVRTYLKALDIMKNVVNLDIQILAIPGIREPIVTDAATLAVQERFDALYIMDIEQQDENGDAIISDSQLPSVINTVDYFVNRSVDSSFAAAYFPDVLYRDPIGVNMQVPPSVLVIGALALNDSVGYPWFAPAGFTRGALPDAALEPRVRLGQTDMDKLYDNSINPIVAFPGAAKGGLNPKGGIVVWGQKTLQFAASALDRVNVRRLLIDIRRQVRDIAQTILFEPNREATLARFSSAVTPRLQRIQALSGLERFKVIIDSSTTTQDDILNNTIRGKIYVQPTKSIEFVSLDFVVANNLTQVQ